MSNKLYGGSLCLTDLIKHAKHGHSAFSKAKNGKVYCNFLSWLNDVPDKYGHHMSHQLSSSQELREREGKIYIGNSKKVETSKPVKPNDIDDDLENVPVREKQSVTEDGYQPVKEPSDDLPF